MSIDNNFKRQYCHFMVLEDLFVAAEEAVNEFGLWADDYAAHPDPWMRAASIKHWRRAQVAVATLRRFAAEENPEQMVRVHEIMEVLWASEAMLKLGSACPVPEVA